MWDETRYPRRNSLNRNVNLIWMKKLNLVILWSISTEVVVKATRGCAVPGEQCRQSSKKDKDRPLGWSSVRGRQNWEGVHGGDRERMIEEGGGELGPCRDMKSKGGEGFKEWRVNSINCSGEVKKNEMGKKILNFSQNEVIGEFRQRCFLHV